MRNKLARLSAKGIVLAVLVIAGALPGFSGDDAVETIDATAFGTSTQMGRNFSVKVLVFRYSTPEERQVLVDAFLKGQHDGLVKALSKMKAVGRISLPGTTGYEIGYATQIPTPTGRKVRFVTERRIAFGEAYHNTQSKSFNLTAGEFDINEQDKNKSTGVLYPAAQLIVNNDGELQWELNKNPWRLVNVIDWNKKGEK